MVLLRPYTDDDKDSVYSVYVSCEDFLSLGPVPIASIDMVDEDLHYSKKSNGSFYVIIYEGKIIGIVDYIPFGYENNPENAYISLIMIAKNYRSKGIGDIVIKEVEKMITKKQSIKKIYSSVQINNERAILFWEKHRYQRISEAELQPDTTIVYHFCKEIHCHE